MAEDECPLLTEVKTEPPDVDDVKYILERSTKMLADDVDSNDLEMSRNVWNGKVEGNSKLELSGPDQEQENIYEIGLVKEDNVDDLSPGYSEDIKIAGNVINVKGLYFVRCMKPFPSVCSIKQPMLSHTWTG